MKLPEQLSQRIANHIESVRRGLANLSPDERQDILQSIEAHIHDALRKRSGDDPTIEGLEAVIAEMDAPDSYTEVATVSSKGNTRRMGVMAASIAVLVVFGGVLWVNRSRTPDADPAHKTLSEETTGERVKQAVMTISRCAETDPKVGKTLASLENLNEELVIEQLNTFLGSEKNTVRRSAIFILWHGGFRDIGPATKTLQDLCSHSEQYTRGMAAIALGENKVQSSFDSLCKMTTDDSDAYARRCAAYALGLLGDGRARPILEEAVKDSDSNVRNNAKAALEVIPKVATKESTLSVGTPRMTEVQTLRTGVLHASNGASNKSPKADSSQDSEDHKRPPIVIETTPRNGDKNVDPGISEIRVTFDKIMLTDRMWSWCYESPDSFPELDGDGVRYIDDRTCVAPVKLKPATSYVIWFNTEKFTSFRDRYHNKAVPYRLEFRTTER